ncbi:CDP-glycerol glycerophosphotransferase family protein [Sphingobium sp.]|uniref:CDP-glycerol glycerophosphotransferase family protein n=1 Tax=Sphingobium sp. TaxID=1912891 RepID=UPI0028BF4523|nr:CDP-glycerol glycerophosphotransferase family protein [Sphingobium sp.]
MKYEFSHIFRRNQGSPQTAPTHEGEILFLFIGGIHQLLHLAPVAAAMARQYPDARINCLYRDDETGEMLQEIRRSKSAWSMQITACPPPGWSTNLGRWLRRPAIEKLPLLYKIARKHRAAQAVVVPERTSTRLRKMGMVDARLIHFRHGAGDRAPRSESRLSTFDLIVVPGQKDIDRAVTQHGVDHTRLRQCGYVKLDYLSKAAQRGHHRLFPDQRPVVLYNPHFDPKISSWHDARQVIEIFSRQDRYNLIVAPHIRISERLSAQQIATWNALSVPGRIIVDLHSRKMVDMSYVLASDIYLGDVSSQLYEFLYQPRPVAFLNSHLVNWVDNPRYAGWHLGSVADHVDDILVAIDEAVRNHARKSMDQIAAVENAFGEWSDATMRGAKIVGNYLGLRST